MIELDANAKLGKEHIKDDPNDITENGKLLLDIVARNNLTIVNTMDIVQELLPEKEKLSQELKDQ